jgi:hypothetical protein
MAAKRLHSTGVGVPKVSSAKLRYLCLCAAALSVIGFVSIAALFFGCCERRGIPLGEVQIDIFAEGCILIWSSILLYEVIFRRESHARG